MISLPHFYQLPPQLANLKKHLLAASAQLPTAVVVHGDDDATVKEASDDAILMLAQLYEAD